MNNYVEVIGNSEYLEYPDQVMIDIDISVRATKEASAERDMREIVNTTIDSLHNEGLTKEEVYFGGKETYTPWWKRNKIGLEIRNRISLKSSDKVKIYKALEKIDRYKKDKRVTFTIDERQPSYISKDEEVNVAMKRACENALEKANCLAKACNRSVGKAIEIEEIKKGVRGSGSYGDYDYGDHGTFAIGAVAGGSADLSDEEPASRLERNTRIIYIKYRIKYELV